MAVIRTTNNPAMLTWAREEVGYTLGQAAEAISVSPETLAAAEAGEHQLTLKQLRTAAEKYECPFGYFYLSTPPYKKSFEPVPDYRIEPGVIGKQHPRLNLEIKRARDRRSTYLELAQSLDIDAPIFQRRNDISEPTIGSRIRERLGVVDAELSSLDFDNAYSYWKTKIECDGVLVYESQYIPDESGVIGAALYYPVCPVILIKRGPTYNARKLFTMLHEYAHLLLGISAINDASAQVIREPSSDRASVEATCNQLAANILIPPEKINPRDYSTLPPLSQMERLAHTFKVTYTTAAVCLRQMGLINQDEFSELLSIRRQAYELDSSKQKKDVKIPRETLMRLDMGRPMFDVVLRAYSTGLLDIFDASKVLSLRIHKIDKLISGAR